MNFGPSAEDYALHRAGFPHSFFERVRLEAPLLDLGAGTGTLARGFAARGLATVALDLSAEMLRQAADLPRRVVARAEAVPLRSGAFGAVVAGTCWHWFDGAAAAAEAWRLLRPGGRLVLAFFVYLAREGNVAEATEALVLRHNPAWPFAGSTGRYDFFRPVLEQAGFEALESFWYDEDVLYSHEGWRGRNRACNGIIALAEPAKVAAFDRDLATLLTGWPEPLRVPHRVFVLSGTKPAAPANRG